MSKNTPQENRGFALLLALVISSIALSIGLSMLYISIKQLTLGTTTHGSEIAFQAANAGMECLRRSRISDETDYVTNGGEVTVDCLGQTGTMTDTNPDNQIQAFDYQFDWTPPGESNERCIKFEAYAFNASSSDVTYNFAPERGIPPRVCSMGDICSTAFVRGFNRSCTEVDAGSIFTVQREISIEF